MSNHSVIQRDAREVKKLQGTTGFVNNEAAEMLWQYEQRLTPPHGMHACDAHKSSPTLPACHQRQTSRPAGE